MAALAPKLSIGIQGTRWQHHDILNDLMIMVTLAHLLWNNLLDYFVVYTYIIHIDNFQIRHYMGEIMGTSFWRFLLLI